VADGWAGDNYPFPPNHQRIDYIYYFPSLNGSIGINSESVEVFPFRGVYRTEDGLTTNEKSDHWSVRGRYKLVLK
jgi:hypothetical protein